MKPILENLIRELKDRFGEAVEDVVEFRNDVFVMVNKSVLVDAATYLRDNPACPFPLCVDTVGIDQFRRKDRYEVSYNFSSVREKVRMHLKVKVDESDLTVPTVSGVFPSVDWYEREVYDMFGIEFTGHPDMRRIYMPEDYEYFPMRKDFPLMGIPGSIPLPKR